MSRPSSRVQIISSPARRAPPDRNVRTVYRFPEPCGLVASSLIVHRTSHCRPCISHRVWSAPSPPVWGWVRGVSWGGGASSGDPPKTWRHSYVGICSVCQHPGDGLRACVVPARRRRHGRSWCLTRSRIPVGSRRPTALSRFVGRSPSGSRAVVRVTFVRHVLFRLHPRSLTVFQPSHCTDTILFVYLIRLKTGLTC